MFSPVVIPILLALILVDAVIYFVIIGDRPLLVPFLISLGTCLGTFWIAGFQKLSLVNFFLGFFVSPGGIVVSVAIVFCASVMAHGIGEVRVQLRSGMKLLPALLFWQSVQRSKKSVAVFYPATIAALLAVLSAIGLTPEQIAIRSRIPWLAFCAVLWTAAVIAAGFGRMWRDTVNE